MLLLIPVSVALKDREDFTFSMGQLQCYHSALNSTVPIYTLGLREVQCEASSETHGHLVGMKCYFWVKVYVKETGSLRMSLKQPQTNKNSSK